MVKFCIFILFVWCCINSLNQMRNSKRIDVQSFIKSRTKEIYKINSKKYVYNLDNKYTENEMRLLKSIMSNASCLDAIVLYLHKYGN